MSRTMDRRLACKTKKQYRAWLLEYQINACRPLSEHLDTVQHAIGWSAKVAVGQEKDEVEITHARILREMKWEAEIIQDLEAELDEREIKRKAETVDDCTADQEESRTA